MWFATRVALKRFFPRVCEFVSRQRGWVFPALSTHITHITVITLSGGDAGQHSGVQSLRRGDVGVARRRSSTGDVIVAYAATSPEVMRCRPLTSTLPRTAVLWNCTSGFFQAFSIQFQNQQISDGQKPTHWVITPSPLSRFHCRSSTVAMSTTGTPIGVGHHNHICKVSCQVTAKFQMSLDQGAFPTSKYESCQKLLICSGITQPGEGQVTQH